MITRYRGWDCNYRRPEYVAIRDGKELSAYTVRMLMTLIDRKENRRASTERIEEIEQEGLING